MPFFFLVLFFLPSIALSGDQIIVTATRGEASSTELPYSVGYIAGSDWETRGGNIEQALSSVPGLSFTSSGGPGQTKGILLRGAKSEHTLVLVDGIIANDPLSPSRGFDFTQMPMEEVDHIEILKGPQSVLYGSDALGGVIQVFTKRGSYNPKILLEAGSYGSAKAAFSAYGFQAAYERSDGFSSADRREGNSERDGYKTFRIGGHKDFSLNARTVWKNTVHYSDANVDTDRSGGRNGDSTGTKSRTSRLQSRSEILYFSDDSWEYSLAASVNIINREDNTSTPSYFKSNLWKAESLSKRKLGRHELSFGVEYWQENGRSSDLIVAKSLYSFGFFAQDFLSYNRLHSTLGARIDFPSEQGSPKTFRTGLGYWIIEKQFRAKGSIGTGFKAPSLYQTYSIYGSRGLSPETSVGGDIGFEYLEKNFESEILWYQNQFKNLIEFNTSTSKYYNLGRAKTYGIEWNMIYRWDKIRLQNSFATTRAYDLNTRLALYRRPSWNNTTELGWKKNAWNLSSQMRIVGPRDDIHPTLYTRQKIPSFFVLGAQAKYNINEVSNLRLRIDNLLNRKYQETSGYGAADFSVYTGLEKQF